MHASGGVQKACLMGLQQLSVSTTQATMTLRFIPSDVVLGFAPYVLPVAT